MTTSNRELFARDPLASRIPNDGVAKVGRPRSEREWDVLRWELRSFVCAGQYAQGLERVLDSFLTNRSETSQPAVWISGFYGSGKSHLARVLEHLWRDVPLPDGSRARELAELTYDVAAHLTELSTAGRRAGGLWSAAGLLASGRRDSVRLAFLAVLFESAGLPTDYRLARFTMWARQAGHFDAINSALAAAGKTYEKEIPNLLVSTVIAQALHEADPTLGDSPAEVRALLKAQYPPADDISLDELVDTMDEVLRMQSSAEGRRPLTLIVLDEMQQYLGDDNHLVLDVQQIVERCSARFHGDVLFVATGQAALTGTPTLQKLTDRFTVPVALSDTDVETVVRQVVLRKKPEHVAGLRAELDAVRPEIDRHLQGTRLAAKAADDQALVPDYPLLPTRRRFWELALRGVDQAGKAGVLRSQLRIVHEATRRTAEKPVGHVVGADFLFDEQAPGMRQSGVLPREIDELIRALRTAGTDGELKARLCALAFLIPLMARTLGVDSGVRATKAFLADLLVEDLADGARLRGRVPELLDELVDEGRLTQIDDEYRLQTEAGAEWEQAFRTALAASRDDVALLARLRGERLVAAAQAELGAVKLVHGSSKTSRRLALHWGEDPPPAGEGDVPVWLRDEWSVNTGAVRGAAAEAGDESPVVFVLLPRHDADHLKAKLAEYAAAEQTLRRSTPQTDEGRDAQRAMRTRLASVDDQISALVAGVVARARIFQGGSAAERTTSGLRQGVEAAARDSLVRLFPRFHAGDNPNWPKVLTRARDGDSEALEAVGHEGPIITNAVCKEVLAAVRSGGTKGLELHKQFGAPPYGWGKDAVNGALMVLLAGRNIRAVQDGAHLNGPKELPTNQIGRAVFHKEDEPPDMNQRLAVRSLLGKAGLPFEPHKEGEKIPALLQRLKDLAAAAGGPAPLPAPPDPAQLDELLTLGGNQQVRAVAEAATPLRENLERWQAAAAQRGKREERWRDLQRLLGHATGLNVAVRLTPDVNAVRDDRQLLDGPDPVPPMIDELTSALRAEVLERAERHAAAQRAAAAELEGSAEWSKLELADQQAIIADAQLVAGAPPDVSTDAALLAALDDTSLSSWTERIEMVPVRHDRARKDAAQRLEPESVPVPLPQATVRSIDDLERYVEDLRARVRPHLDAGRTVIL
jgi:hypothetical protein